jgi:hypothetical protein
MPVFAGEFVQVVINGTDRSEYVVSYNRQSSICELGDTFTLTLSEDFPAALDAYDSIAITESYGGDSGLVLRGYITSVSQDFEGSNFVLQGSDKSILLREFFIAEQVEANNESVDYWINNIVERTGLTISFQATAPNVFVEKGTLLGMQTAAESLITLERLAAYYIRYDSATDQLIAFRLDTSEPAMTIDEPLAAIRALGTDKTRNVVKVYGGWKYDVLDPLAPPVQLFSTVRSEIPGLLVDKTTVISNPYLKRQSYLYIVANRLLNVTNSIDDVQEYNLAGFYPDIDVGNVAYINVDDYISYNGDRVITTIVASVSNAGVTTSITVGEKCPRISVQLPQPPLYGAVRESGVAVSWDGGDSFQPSNMGLTTTDELFGKNIAVNSYGQQMVITAAGIYKRPSSLASWTPIADLPDPVNESADPVPVTASGLTNLRIVDEPTNYSVFHLLVTGMIASQVPISGFARAWIYTTQNFGTDWTSTQLYVPASGTLVTETMSGIPGRVYDVLAHDLTAGINNNAYVEVSARLEADSWAYPFVPEPTFADGFYFLGHDPTPYPPTADNEIYFVERDGTRTNVTGKFPFYPTTQGGLFTVPGARNVVYIHSLFGESIRVDRSLDSADTWDTVVPSGPISGIPSNHDIFTLQLVVDYSSLKVDNKVRFCIHGYAIEDGPISSGTAKYVYYAIFFEDDLDGTSATVDYVSTPVPSMSHTYSDRDGDAVVTGQFVRYTAGDEDEKNGYFITGSQAYAHTEFAYGNNLAFQSTIFAVRPRGKDLPPPPPADYTDFFPGHANIVTAAANFDSKSISVISSTRVNEYFYQTSALFGPHDPDAGIYPDADSDGNSYELDLHFGTAREGQHSFAAMWKTDNNSQRKLVPIIAIAGGSHAIDNPVSIPPSKQELYEDTRKEWFLAGTDNTANCGRYGPEDTIFDPVDTIDATIYTWVGTGDESTISGQIMQNSIVGPHQTEGGYQYIMVRDDWDTGEPIGSRGKYNIYERPEGGGTFQPVFPTSVEWLANGEQPPFGLTHANTWAIAEEVLITP